MSLVDHEQLISMEAKIGNAMTIEEERDQDRQRLQGMKLVLKELQQQLCLYKTRCSGVNTIAVMLQESKQEVVKLTKQHKALETAITNLQNRLSTNGLSSSVNLEETEMFVPGASKQTLDNLAKENARLRALLKNHEGQIGVKSSEDIQKMAAVIEKLEAENSQLRTQLQEIDHWKVKLTNQFEDEIKQIKDEKLQLEQELSQQQEARIDNSVQNEKQNINDNTFYKTGPSKSSQRLDMEASSIDEVRRNLKVLSDQCVILDQSLENLQITAKNEVINEASPTDKNNMISEEAYLDLKLKFTQVVQMNQHWQHYNEMKEQQIHELVSRIAELEELNKNTDEMRSALESREIENQNLRRDTANLTREVNKFKSQPLIDASLVEILKQQIQVCTEDFNTERKDRELAVNKVKQLQEDLHRMGNENDILKREVDNLQKFKSKNNPEVMNQTWIRPSQVLPQYYQRVGQSPPQRLPFSSTSSGTSQLSSHSLSPIPSPVPMSFSSTSSTDKSSYYHENVPGFHAQTRGGLKQQVGQFSNQSSFPRARGPQESLSDSGIMQRGTGSNASMPALSVKSEEMPNTKHPDLTCPKCSKEFTESQQSELINHINNCPE